MGLAKANTSKSGAPVGYHRITQIIIQNDGDNSKAFIGVQSYFDQAAKDAGKPSVENTQVQLAVDLNVNITGENSVGAMYNRLASEAKDANDNDNPFNGATEA